MHKTVPDADAQLNQRDAEYRNYSDDRTGPESNEHKSAHTTYQSKLKEYQHSILSSYNKSHMPREVLWEDFITASCPQSTWLWSRVTLTECENILTQRRIYVQSKWKKAPANETIDISYRQTHIGPASNTTTAHKTTNENNMPQVRNTMHQPHHEEETARQSTDRRNEATRDLED